MNRIAWLSLACLAAACSGDKDKGNTDGDTGDAGPPSFEFNTSVKAKSFVATIAPDTVAAHQVVTALLAGTAVVVSDDKVQDRLRVDGGGEEPPALRAAYGRCWSRPEHPMFSFTIDYTGCQPFNMGGGVFVIDHPSGPLLFGFYDFFIADRTVGGTLAFDTRGAYPSPYFWKVYNTDNSNPGEDNRVPIGVTLDRTSYGVTYDGGASVSFFQQTWSMWGVLETGPIENPVQVVLGGVEPGDVAPDERPGENALKSSLNWLECRCPTSGVATYDMPLHFTEVTVDIDDLEVDPDGIDDPEMVIPLDYDLEGRAILTHVGCGEYDVEYQAEDASIPLSSDRLVGAVSFLCDTRAISDLNRCNALVDAARDVGDGFVIEVKKADATKTANKAVEDEFDTNFCKIY
ncbi:MAG: hypothetical protein KC621_23280 [Myxococcales bacterium]|nr:hypothetical protein [Myxococcales bacterium]